MCGFAGFLNFKADFYTESRNMTMYYRKCHVLYHRGPDENGRVLTKQYGLAHTRLAIIDLDNGQQTDDRQNGWEHVSDCV